MYEKIKEYLEWKATHHYPASVSYRKSLERFVEICGEKGIEKYTVKDVVCYTNVLAKKYANETIRFSLAIIKNFFRYYNSQKYDCLIPFLIQLPRRKAANSHRAITPKEFEKIISVVSPDGLMALRDMAMVSMLWDTGVRVSELCRINIDDLENKRACVGTSKTSDGRIVIWTESTQACLNRYVAELKKIDGAENLGRALFVNLSRNNRYARLTTRSIERIVKRYGEVGGLLSKVTPHRFRHGWAQERKNKRMPLSFIQKGLGHRDPKSTQTYQQYSDPEFEMEARAFFQITDNVRKSIFNFPQHLIQMHNLNKN